jgi:PAS domain S-box-containing protein
MKNYTEMTNEELTSVLDELQAKVPVYTKYNEVQPVPIEEELQGILDELQTKQRSNFLAYSTVNALQHLLHELKLHQVKLEIQNRELRETRLRLKDAHKQQFIRTALLDISERAEDGVRTAKEPFHLLANYSPVLLWINGLEGCEFVNRAYLNFIDVATSVNVRGYDWSQYVHPDDREAYLKAYLDAFAAQAPFSAEFRFRRYDGEYCWMRSEANPRYSPAGAFLGYVGASVNITQRKQNEEQLHEQAAMLNQAREAILIRGLDGTIQFWNQGAERLYGWSSAEVVGKSATQFLYHGESSQFAEAFSSVLEKGAWRGEIRQFTKDGNELIVEAQWSLIRDAQERPKAILAIKNDITEKKKLETQFLQAQRMESLGSLAGGIAHDLNNILSPVLMGVQLLRTKLSDDEAQHWLDIMRSNIERGAGLIKQILLFARGIQGKRVPLQPKHLLRETIKILSETFPNSLAIKFQIPENLALVKGDTTQLYQVLMNLCVNARDAMPEGGELLIEARNVMLSEQCAALEGNR